MIDVIGRLESILDVAMDIPVDDPARPGVKAASPIPLPESTRLTRIGVYINTLIFDLTIERDAIERAQLQQATQQPS